MTSTDALYRRDQPDSLVVLSGRYIAVELGYFFESLGTDVKLSYTRSRSAHTSAVGSRLLGSAPRSVRMPVWYSIAFNWKTVGAW